MSENQFSRAPKQKFVWKRLIETPEPLLTQLQLADYRAVLKTMQQRGWVEKLEYFEDVDEENLAIKNNDNASAKAVELNFEQENAVNKIKNGLNRFQCFLLHGVTGSGKTEVYMELIEALLPERKQTLILLPEIALTPQMKTRFIARFGSKVVMFHSAMSEVSRRKSWKAMESGEALVALGTRSAVFIPLCNPALLVVDEEHDNSYKQQDGFKYSARDLAVQRASISGIPIVLGSATPSLESLHNAKQKRYQYLQLNLKANRMPSPQFEIVDIRTKMLKGGLSADSVKAIEDCLAAKEQAILLVNRRGYAPVLMCHYCGQGYNCDRCDAYMVYHQANDKLQCHHCGSERKPPNLCPNCAQDTLINVGIGTEKVEQVLAQTFPDTRILRMDKDSASKRGSLEAMIESITKQEVDVLVGTQMLAKGHHFPNVTLAIVLDIDGGLMSGDFRATELIAQLIVQVAGRAGRGERPGRVIIQTHLPENPLLTALCRGGYNAFSELALQQREAAGLPPFSYLALIRAESIDATLSEQFLHMAIHELKPLIHVFGPIKAAMARRKGRYRMQILIESKSRIKLQKALKKAVPIISKHTLASKVKWSVDVDPREII